MWSMKAIGLAAVADFSVAFEKFRTTRKYPYGAKSRAVDLVQAANVLIAGGVEVSPLLLEQVDRADKIKRLADLETNGDTRAHLECAYHETCWSVACAICDAAVPSSLETERPETLILSSEVA